MVRALSFSKSYDSKAACSGVTMEAERGRVTVLLGPNGAGKSTLLKAFCAQHYASAGKILVECNDGAVFDAAENPEQVKAVAAFVSDVPALYDDWTVWEFLCMAAELRETAGKPKTAAAESVGKPKTDAAQNAALLCGLNGVLKQKISSLSHGFRQRVNFAQALVCDPQILILDEPATGLDPRQIREMRTLLQSLKSGRAIVFSTHIIQEAEALADKIVIMNRGRVAASGTAKELLKASGAKSLEDAYLFFTGGAAASSNPSASTDSSLASNPNSSSVPGSPTAPWLSSFLRLVKKELRAFAINPFYWIAGAAFNLFCAAAYFYGTRFFVQGAGSAALSPFFLLMPRLLSILFPAFCMNIKSRAFDQSLPFCPLSKAAARLSSALIVFALYLAPTLFVPLCVSRFGSVDAGAVFVSYLGLIFFAAACLSFCVFLSVFCKSRAAFFALAAIFLLAINSVHLSLNYIPLSDFLSSCVRASSFAWKFDSASKGVLDTRDFSSLALAALFFLSLSVFVEERKKGKKYFGKRRALKTFTVIFVFLFLALDASRLYARLDFTANKDYTPSERTKKTLSAAQEKIRATYYRSSELLKLYPQIRDAADFLRSISLSCKNFEFTELDADSAASQKILESLSVQPFQIQKQKNNSLEYAASYAAVVIDYMDKTLVIPAAFSTFSLEYDLNLRLDYLLNKKSRAAYVLCGNGMNLKKDFKAALDWLNVEGFETIPLTADDFAEQSGAGGRALDPKNPLVLFGSSSLSPSAAKAIEEFLQSGGSLFVAASPYSANVDGDWSLKKNRRDWILPILERRGISFLDSVSADVSSVRADFRSTSAGREENVSVNYSLWISVLPQEAAPFGATVFWASPLSLDKEKAAPLLLSSPASWRFLPDKKNPALLFDTNPFTVPKFPPADPLVQRERSVLAAKTLDKKIIVVSGELFANDLLLSLSGGEAGDFRNLNFLTAALLELSGESDLAALKNKGASDRSLWKISDGAEWLKAKNETLALCLGLAPVIPLLLCAIFFFRRRKESL